jgi:ABC-type transporter Mla subunit MlaD
MSATLPPLGPAGPPPPVRSSRGRDAVLAISLVPGLDVQANGVDVGKITSVDYSGGRAVVGIGIDDETFWPLRRGTTATIRYGTTAGNGTRRIDLVPGPKSAPAIGEGGVIGARDTRVPVEFDDIFRTIDRDTRTHLRSLVGRPAETLDGRGDDLNAGLKATAPALRSAGGLFGELASDEAALRQVIGDTHRVTSTLDARRGQVADLITVAGTTFDEFARHTGEIGDSLDQAPATLRSTRQTLGRLDETVGLLRQTVRDAAPGAATLPGLAAAARPAVAQLRATAPRLTSLLRTGRAAAPDATRLLTQGTPFAKRMTPILSDLTPHVACLRPYAPEVAGTLSTWASFAKNYDGYGHYARMRILAGPTSVTSTPELPTERFTQLTGQGYALPRPPGLNAGKPWFLPECGVGPSALDPARDPENRR